MDSAAEPDTTIWEPVNTNSGVRYRCRVCNDMHLRELRRTAAHETTQDHRSALEYYRHSSPAIGSPPPNELPMAAFVADGVRSLLDSLAAPAGYGETDAPLDYGEPSPALPQPRLVNWGLSENTQLEPSMEKLAVAQIAQTLADYFDADPPSDDEIEERSEGENDAEEVTEPTVTGKLAFSTQITWSLIFLQVDNGEETEDGEHGLARTRDNTERSRQWYPWSDRITCTLDVLMHLPRSVFSHRQLELFIWLLKVNNVDDVPSVKSMQELNAMLQKLCGIESIAYNGALGHKYYVNSMAQIIAQHTLDACMLYGPRLFLNGTAPVIYLPTYQAGQVYFPADFYRKTFGVAPSDTLAHLKRELMYGIWDLLLSPEFIHTYIHGIVINCYDGIEWRVFPRLFTCGADYPEKRYSRDGPKANMQKRAKIRDVTPWYKTMITIARRWIFGKGYFVAGAAVNRVLKLQSWVPTTVQCM
ncbi:hypothetical protein C8R46DRAFT_1249207 [Mycena filopes]|nr:hypothetical protein C8R46DRAFT_1249207 [Mycena filopes]